MATPRKCEGAAYYIATQLVVFQRGPLFLFPLTMSDYSEKLKDPRWQKKRLEILDRDQFTCQYCGDKESTLHVHHLRYERGADPWEYGEGDLVALCETCHEVETKSRKDAEREVLDALRNSLFSVGDLLDLAKGISTSNLANEVMWNRNDRARFFCGLSWVLHHPPLAMAALLFVETGFDIGQQRRRIGEGE